MEQIRECFGYLGFNFTPVAKIEDREGMYRGFSSIGFYESVKHLNTSVLRKEYNYEAFYEEAKTVGADDYDIFECEGITVMPTGGTLMRYDLNAVIAVVEEPKAHEKVKTLSGELSAIMALIKNEESVSGFYPTPDDIVHEMVAGLDWKKIEYVLEPSAGKGDLVNGLKKWRETVDYNYRHRKLSIDCIEINPMHQSILKGEGMNVVYDDFLTFDTHKSYDLIIMNPPFDNAVDHLLKALAMQRSGGMVVSLLNAETLHNLCTAKRKELMKQLDRYEAIITYYKNSFSDAERQTDVDVAMVKVVIPEAFDRSDIFERMERAESEKEEIPRTCTDVAPSDIIKSLIRQFNIEVSAGKELIRQYAALRPYILHEFPEQIAERARNGWGNNSSAMLKLMCGEESATINLYITQVRTKYWDAFFTNSELMDKLTSEMQQKFRNMVRSLSEYDFNEYNIRQIMTQMQGDLYQGVEDAIVQIFDKLTLTHSYNREVDSGNVHYYNGWCANSAYKVNNKVIIPAWGIFSNYSWDRDAFKVREAYGALADIEKALNYLDGGLTREVDIIETLEHANRSCQTRKIPLKYFTVTFFKKGTLHIQFNEDAKPLLEKFNIYASRKKGWLPPAYGRKKYVDMDADEREVVDSFQGEAAYNEVMAKSDYYLAETSQMLALGA